MPYLAYLFCEDCGVGANLDIDPGATIEAYIEEGRKKSFINPATLVWDYLFYECPRCLKKFKYTFVDVERRVREHFAAKSKEYAAYFEELKKRGEDEQVRTSSTSPLPVRSVDRIRKIYTAK